MEELFKNQEEILARIARVPQPWRARSVRELVDERATVAVSALT